MPATATSGIKLRRRKETTFGTAPSGAYDEIRFRGETLQPNPTYVQSQVIRSDGQVSNVIRTDAEGGGQVTGELSYSDWDDWFESVLLSEVWTAEVTHSAVNIQVIAPTGGVPGRFSRATGSWSSDGFLDGAWIKVAGNGNSANNTYYKIVEISGALYVQGNPDMADVASASGTTVTQLGQVLNGKSVVTWLVEREDTDAEDSDEFARYSGSGVQSAVVEIPTTGLCTTAFNLISKAPTSNGSTAASSNNTLPTTEPMAASDVDRVFEGDPGIGVISSASLLWDVQPFTILGYTLNISPGLRTRKACGTVGPALVHGRGTMVVTGSIRLYYHAEDPGTDRDDKVLFDKILNNTVSGLAIALQNAAGELYIFDTPRLKFTGGRRNAPGEGQDVILDMQFTAYRHPDENNPNTGVSGVTCRIARGDLIA